MIVDPFSAAKQCWDTGWSVGLPQKKKKTPSKVAFQSGNTEVLVWRKDFLKGVCKENLVRFLHPSWIKQVVMSWNCSRICSGEALDAGTGFQAIQITKTDCRDTLENAGVLIWFDLQLPKKYSSGGMYSCIMIPVCWWQTRFSDTLRYFRINFWTSAGWRSLYKLVKGGALLSWLSETSDGRR